jgi:hypothetical protein
VLDASFPPPLLTDEVFALAHAHYCHAPPGAIGLTTYFLGLRAAILPIAGLSARRRADPSATANAKLT